jgi:hypothetical protein
MTGVNKSSVQLFHFVAAIDEQRGMHAFCCESQPMATVRSHGLPSRCPFCRKENPISTSLSMKKDGNHQEKI